MAESVSTLGESRKDGKRQKVVASGGTLATTQSNWAQVEGVSAACVCVEHIKDRIAEQLVGLPAPRTRRNIAEAKVIFEQCVDILF